MDFRLSYKGDPITERFALPMQSLCQFILPSRSRGGGGKPEIAHGEKYPKIVGGLNPPQTLDICEVAKSPQTLVIRHLATTPSNT